MFIFQHINEGKLFIGALELKLFEEQLFLNNKQTPFLIEINKEEPCSSEIKQQGNIQKKALKFLNSYLILLNFYEID